MAASPSPKPSPHEVVPLLESDAIEVAELEVAAFQNEPIARAMFGAPTRERITFRANQFTKTLTEDRTAWLTKVMIDGKIAAIAEWKTLLDTDWHLQDTDKPENPWPPGANVAACEDFFGWLFGVRKRKMGGIKHIRMFG